eukprot:CAMPEP_0179050500 /NCGR_PEP_ID=MMETSP0796-20121207/20758_1 /TAXON_ID=73915 /ORGANISM="Pyrodinium bahamense, Strain pbaha01" /LENGTH=231 /DNA_ID=CAMNT_0020747005 /DNA_START=272 /DNA_END=968 /DNA_ORIENTATION=+
MISLTHHLASPGSCSIHVVVPPDELLKAEALVRCFRHETGTLPGTPAIILHELRPLPFPLAYYQVPLAIYWTRVFLHEYLPTAPRVIWLDHDTVIRADLSELYKMRMEHALAGAPEFVQPHLVRMMTFRDHIRECPHVTHYMGGTLMDSATFNTGILVFDLNKWRSGAGTAWTGGGTLASTALWQHLRTVSKKLDLPLEHVPEPKVLDVMQHQWAHGRRALVEALHCPSGV